MNTYITTAQVEAIKGPEWYGTGDPDQAVLEANVWMTAYGVPVKDPQEDAVTQAGAILAVEAANGRLYADSAGTIKRKAVKADTVESETEYMDGSAPSSGALSLVYAMLRPYVNALGLNQIAVRRI